jgi:hypothetical protein
LHYCGNFHLTICRLKLKGYISNQGKEIERKIVDGIVGEIDCGLYLDIDIAMIIADWLNERIKEYNKITKGN